MVVTLSTLQILAKEDPPDVAGQQSRLALAAQEEPRGGAAGGVDAVGDEDLADELVVGGVGGE